MKSQNRRQQILAKSILLSFGFPVLLASAATANTVGKENYRPVVKESVSELQPGMETAQGSNTCYQVIAKYGLYVREAPTVYSRAIGILNYGQNVTISPGGTENWMPIAAPVRGYVWADWVAPC